MSWRMAEQESNEVKKYIAELGRFDKILLIDREGNLLLKAESKDLRENLGGLII